MEDLRTWRGAAEGTHDTNPEVLVSHADAALTPRHRRRLARSVVEDGWSISCAAAVSNVARPTAERDRHGFFRHPQGVSRSWPHRSRRQLPSVAGHGVCAQELTDRAGDRLGTLHVEEVADPLDGPLLDVRH
jgi:hypothetical protein